MMGVPMLLHTRARRSRLQFPEERDLGELLRVQDVPVDTARLFPFAPAADDGVGRYDVIESEIVSQRENVGEVGEPSTGLLFY